MPDTKEKPKELEREDLQKSFVHEREKPDTLPPVSRQPIESSQEQQQAQKNSK
ncbi:hypothetical protein IT568_07895 [bacterium]|nr:hypothetical protein [bacterium]